MAWKDNVYKVGNQLFQEDSIENPDKLREQIEPWLSAVFQSDHLALLVGSGLTSAVAALTETDSISMATVAFGADLSDKVNEDARASAEKLGRGAPNVEDQLRSALSLVRGLSILGDQRAEAWEQEVDTAIFNLVQAVETTEKGIHYAVENETPGGVPARRVLVSFLMSFASRAPSRERLNLFTTNYDRLLEYASDHAGLRLIDRFVGTLTPEFRSSRLEIDMHYNPPGIRGEPRFLEGVVRFTKLHGSVDWYAPGGRIVRRLNLPFGSGRNLDQSQRALIYPNPAKDVETSQYPYADMFRDFSASICRPNSVLVTYGYGFGDDHINRIIEDMLTISSTLLVILSWDQASQRIPMFYERVGHNAQISLLVGPHFGDLKMLVDNYLPKPAIDTISNRRGRLLRNRAPVGIDATDVTVEGEA